MIHQRQHLPLDLEAGDDLPGVHAGLDDLQGDLAPDRLGLLSHENDAHPALADLLQQLIGADDIAGRFSDGRGFSGDGTLVEQALVAGVGIEKHLDVAAEFPVFTTGFV